MFKQCVSFPVETDPDEISLAFTETHDKFLYSYRYLHLIYQTLQICLTFGMLKCTADFRHYINELEQDQQNDKTNSEDSDQPGYHPVSRIFMDSYGPKPSLGGQKTLIRLRGCPGRSGSSLDTHTIVLSSQVLSNSRWNGLSWILA